MLNFVRTSADRVSSALKAAGGIPNKCGNVNIDKDVSKVNLTCGVVTPITEYVGKLAADIESLYSVMVPIVIINETSKLEDNKTYHFDGYTHRDPHTGRVVFLCERVRPRDDDIKSYKLDDDKWERLKKFRPKNWKEKTISSKINDVLYELKVNHHKMNKRNEIALATLLTYASPLDYVYGNYGTTGNRGWMETYIAGDTTTGKSEVVLKTMAAIGLGFLVEGESVSYPGMVGATFQHPGHKGYAINWGLFPRHDKRLVVVDEAHNENAMDVLPRLNDVRRSGIAKITKACQGTAPARVRKIVVSNPPHQNTTDDYGFNVEIMRDVMKTPEAIARFDLFLCTRNVDTSTTEATAISMDIPEYYGPDLNELIRFIWSITIR